MDGAAGSASMTINVGVFRIPVYKEGMKTLELNGVMFLVSEKRPLERDRRRDRWLMASEIVATFERQGYGFALPTRSYHVECLCKSVPFVRLVCGVAVPEVDLAAAAEIPTGWLSQESAVEIPEQAAEAAGRSGNR